MAGWMHLTRSSQNLEKRTGERCPEWAVSCPGPFLFMGSVATCALIQPSWDSIGNLGVECFCLSSDFPKHLFQSLNHVQLFATPWTATSQASLSITTSQARFPCPSPPPGVYLNSGPLSQWCHPTISSSVVTFSCLQSFPISGSFQMSQLFASGGQNIGVSASTSVLPMNTQDWSPLGRTGWTSLQSKGLWRVFSNTTTQKHQFFGAQLSL